MKNSFLLLGLLIFFLNVSCKASILHWDFTFEVTNMRTDYPQPAAIGDIFEGSMSYSYNGQGYKVNNSMVFDLNYLFIDIPLLTTGEWLGYNQKSRSNISDRNYSSGLFNNSISSWFDIQDATGAAIYGESIHLDYMFDISDAVITDFKDPLNEWHLIPLGSIEISYYRHLEDVSPVDLSGIATEFKLREVPEPNSMILMIMFLLLFITSFYRASVYQLFTLAALGDGIT